MRRVAQGSADYCLTSVLHYLSARAESGALAARFVAVVTQRSPMAAIVADDSQLRSPGDLAGARVGGPPGGRLMAEYRAALRAAGVGEPTVVRMDYAEGPAALGRGVIDAVADFADILPRVRRQAGIGVRAIAVGREVYASGLVAGDHLADEAVSRMRAAVAAALHEQRRDPERGVAAMCSRYPGLEPDDVREGWSLVEPNIFTGVEPGSMRPGRWLETLRAYTEAHGLPSPQPDTVFRPHCCDAP